MWSYQEHQIEGARWALATIREYGLAYLAWEERTRKTGASLLTVENSLAQNCLIVTKKKALDGWKEHLSKHDLKKNYTLVHFEGLYSRKKVKGKLQYNVNFEPEDYDFIILDEAHHAISACPKPSLTWKIMATLTKAKPILYLSATPYAEHLGLVYHQLKLSSWTPFMQPTFYQFHREFGIPDFEYTPTPRETYKKYKKEEILSRMGHLFNFKKRKEVGIEHEPTVKLIKVDLSQETKAIIKVWVKDRVLEIKGHTLVNDNPGIARSVHYQLEGGTIKGVGFIGMEKVNYIKANYHHGQIAIMAHFILERTFLEAMFPTVRILSSDGDAEGVDLSGIEKLIIYSMSDKTSKYTQRLARQANHDRKTPIEVDIIVANKPGIGLGIYNSVALKKENFVKDSYDRYIDTILL